MSKLVKVKIDWWLSPFGRDDLIPMIGTPMDQHGYVKVASEEVMIHRPEIDPDKCQLESLKQQRAALAAQKERELAEYDRKIQEITDGQ